MNQHLNRIHIAPHCIFFCTNIFTKIKLYKHIIAFRRIYSIENIKSVRSCLLVNTSSRNAFRHRERKKNKSDFSLISVVL